MKKEKTIGILIIRKDDENDEQFTSRIFSQWSELSNKGKIVVGVDLYPNKTAKIHRWAVIRILKRKEGEK